MLDAIHLLRLLAEGRLPLLMNWRRLDLGLSLRRVLHWLALALRLVRALRLRLMKLLHRLLERGLSGHLGRWRDRDLKAMLLANRRRPRNGRCSRRRRGGEVRSLLALRRRDDVLLLLVPLRLMRRLGLEMLLLLRRWRWLLLKHHLMLSRRLRRLLLPHVRLAHVLRRRARLKHLVMAPPSILKGRLGRRVKRRIRGRHVAVRRHRRLLLLHLLKIGLLLLRLLSLDGIKLALGVPVRLLREATSTSCSSSRDAVGAIGRHVGVVHGRLLALLALSLEGRGAGVAHGLDGRRGSPSFTMQMRGPSRRRRSFVVAGGAAGSWHSRKRARVGRVGVEDKESGLWLSMVAASSNSWNRSDDVGLKSSACWSLGHWGLVVVSRALVIGCFRGL